jgi:UDP-N-acetyl-2-amino-2-deoxyglucuronate dehydrogenase
MRRKGTPISFLSVCSPNYLHDSHIRFGLRSGAHVICEKPLVLNPWNLDALEELERETGRRVYNVLQLRLHPAIRALRERYGVQGPSTRKHDVELAYVTSRGRWYHVSWKGSPERSGGIATNIGIHFFDMLQWVFGPASSQVLHLSNESSAAGYLELERARVRWFLSIDERTLPPEARAQKRRTHRSIRVDGEEIEFSEGFTDLHTETYRDILSGGGYGLKDARSAVQLAHDIRHARIQPAFDDAHPLVRPFLATLGS